ncbi:MAG: aminotransferase class I/II-fold pyridoxal phosphate-dependent enzyme [Alphaproteobacteria bacterium]|nr:aminotransferase class I/II-fold pyridoxal phosphate-dependent enzyme [Alphaproteobacteria bacterium]
MPLKTGRAASVPAFIVMDIIKAANARDSARAADRAMAADPATRTIHMEVGQPSTGAPRGVVEAAKRALDSGAALGYTEALGIPPLRAALAAHYRDTYKVEVPPDRIAITVGASGAFPLAFLAAFDPGDRIALATPFYPPYVNILQALGFRPVLMEAGADSRFQPTIAMLEALAAGPEGPPDGLIIASPCNPAGTMLHADELAGLAAWCERRGVRLIADEIYHGLAYEQPAETILRYSRTAIVVNSFSKYFSMTGWRLGWLVLPEDLVRPVECLTQNLFISPPTISQQAAVAAFDCHEELQANIRRYAENRALLLAELPQAGFDRLAPAEGAFYIYADVGHLTNDSMEFCRRMLSEIGVAATPGLDFDRGRGSRFLRFSFAGSTADMAEAARRLKGWRAR